MLITAPAMLITAPVMFITAPAMFITATAMLITAPAMLITAPGMFITAPQPVFAGCLASFGITLFLRNKTTCLDIFWGRHQRKTSHPCYVGQIEESPPTVLKVSPFH